MNWSKFDGILSNPVTGLVLFLIPSFLFFTGSSSWWLYQLAIQIPLCFLGLWFRGWRFVYAVILLGILFFNFSWFKVSKDLPVSCGDQIDEISGITSIDSKKVSDSVGLIKVEIHCKNDSLRRPVGKVILGDSKARGSWYRSGDRIRLRNVEIGEVGRFSVDIRPIKRFRVYNLTRREKTLDRGRLLLYIQAKARYYLGGFTNAIYKAMVTADRSSISTEWSDSFRRLGISHLFAISGLHVGLLYFWVYWFFRVVAIAVIYKSETGAYLVVIDIICVVLLYTYLDIIGMPISAKRAFIMLTWLIILRWFLFWQPLWMILLGTASLILIASPGAIGQVSFQLSFLSVAGIIHILPILPRQSSRHGLLSSFGKTIVSSMLISFWLFALNFPIINSIYPTFSIITVLNNLLHILFFSVIFLPLALGLLGCSIISYPLGFFPGEYYLFAVLNVAGKCWEWLLVKTIMVNQWFTFTWQINWDWYDYLVYWMGLTSVSVILMRRWKVKN